METKPIRVQVELDTAMRKIISIRLMKIEREYNIIKYVELALLKEREIYIRFQLTRGLKNINLRYIFERLEYIANKYNIEKMAWKMNDDIFKIYPKEIFMTVANLTLNRIQIYLLDEQKIVKSGHEKWRLMRTYHKNDVDGTHCGYKKLFAKLYAEYYWYNMTRDIARCIKGCSVCNLMKKKNK